MDSCDLTMRITALANVIARELSTDDLAVTAAVFAQLGDTLATIAAQRARCENMKNLFSENKTD